MASRTETSSSDATFRQCSVPVTTHPPLHRPLSGTHNACCVPRVCVPGSSRSSWGDFEMKRLSVPVALLFVAVSVVASPAAARPAVTLTCGQTITENTKLTSDIGPCDGDGLVIGADNITLDLGGHTISAVAQPSTAGAWTGVRVGGHDGVTVRKGKILGFTPYVNFSPLMVVFR